MNTAFKSLKENGILADRELHKRQKNTKHIIKGIVQD